jgi:hypothetical protein
MNFDKLMSVANALVVKEVLSKSSLPVTVALNIMGKSLSEAFKRTTTLPKVDMYTPNDPNDEALAEFCRYINDGEAKRVAARELLINTPYHLMSGNDINSKLATAKLFTDVKEKLTFMTRKEVFDTLSTKDSNQARVIKRLVETDKLIELKVGEIADAIFPAFQFDDDLNCYEGISNVVSFLHENQISTLTFCGWMANEEDGFLVEVKAISRKYAKNPYRVFASPTDTNKLLQEWFENLNF